MRCLAVDFGGTLARPGPEPDGVMVADRLAGIVDAAVPAGFAAAFDAVRLQVRAEDRRSHEQTPFARMLSRAARECGGALMDPEATAEAVFFAVPDAKVDQRAANALRQLYIGGLVCILACNTQRPEVVRRRTLERAGIADCFTALVLSSSVGVRKPHPAFYTAVLDSAQTDPEQVLFIGDTPAKDVTGPRAHGMRAVLVAPRGQPAGVASEVPVIAHFAELPALLDSYDVR